VVAMAGPCWKIKVLRYMILEVGFPFYTAIMSIRMVRFYRALVTFVLCTVTMHYSRVHFILEKNCLAF